MRSLVEDLGEALGCGGHVSALRRLSAGPYPAERMMTLEQLGEIKAEGGFEASDEWPWPLSTPCLLHTSDASDERHGSPLCVPRLT